MGAYLHVFMIIMSVQARGGQKKAQDTLEQELQLL